MNAVMTDNNLNILYKATLPKENKKFNKVYQQYIDKD